MKHNKLRIARQLRHRSGELSTPVFQTKAWEAMKAKKIRETKKREANQKRAAELRRKKLEAKDEAKV
jgi:hypothetical protein